MCGAPASSVVPKQAVQRGEKHGGALLKLLGQLHLNIKSNLQGSAEIRPRSSSWPQSGTCLDGKLETSLLHGWFPLALSCFGLSVLGGEQDARDPC